MNHNENVYEHADSFIPERWIKKDRQIQTFDQYAFPIFQGGPRICLGKDLAVYETKMLLVEVLRHYRCEMADEKYREAIQQPKWRNDVTMIDGNPVYTQNLALAFIDDLNLRMYRR